MTTTGSEAEAQQSDPPGWRLVFLLSRSWGACARVLTVLTALVGLAAIALGAAAAVGAYLLARLVPVLTLLPPTTAAAIAGAIVTSLTAGVLGRRAVHAWRAARTIHSDPGRSPEPGCSPAVDEGGATSA